MGRGKEKIKTSKKKTPNALPKKFIFLLALVLVLFFLQKRVSFNDSRPSNIESTPESASSKTQRVNVFLIALDDNGVRGKKVGCGDSAISFERKVTPTKAVLKAAIDELLGLQEQTYGDGLLYNAMAGSKLRADTISIDGTGLAKIELSGAYRFTGVCEDARFIAQVKETALQFESVREVKIFLNGKDLDNLYEAPTRLRSGYLLRLLRWERNPAEAENSSLSSTALGSRFSAKADK